MPALLGFCSDCRACYALPASRCGLVECSFFPAAEARLRLCMHCCGGPGTESKQCPGKRKCAYRGERSEVAKKEKKFPENSRGKGKATKMRKTAVFTQA